MKQKKCRYCKQPFAPVLPMQVVCGIECAKAIAKSKREKVEKANDRQKREQLKTRSQWMKEAQIAFNAFIRERDHNEPCISCGRYHTGQYHAGHYRTVGSHPELRFDERNCHKQCAPCNNHKSGNIVEYRINLVRKLGAESVEWLEGPHEAKHYAVEELVAITKLYRAKRRELVKVREGGRANGIVGRDMWAPDRALLAATDRRADH